MRTSHDPRRVGHTLWKLAGAGCLLLLLLVVAGLLFYASTAHFSNLVRQKVISVLEDATGGRVELQSLRWNLRHLAVEVNGLTIHGLEGQENCPTPMWTGFMRGPRFFRF